MRGSVEYVLTTLHAGLFYIWPECRHKLRDGSLTCPQRKRQTKSKGKKAEKLSYSAVSVTEIKKQIQSDLFLHGASGPENVQNIPYILIFKDQYQNY